MIVGFRQKRANNSVITQKLHLKIRLINLTGKCFLGSEIELVIFSMRFYLEVKSYAQS